MRRLLLHACCAPCTTATLETLIPRFSDGEISVFFYNPNIAPVREHNIRRDELGTYLRKRYGDDIPLVCPPYENKEWQRFVSPLRTTGERGERCRICYYLRLLRTFEYARENAFSHVSTTLTISPHKKFSWLRDLGTHLSRHFGVAWIAEKWDYRRSIELSKEYGLYRQDYCGCSYSLAERNQRKKRANRDS